MAKKITLFKSTGLEHLLYYAPRELNGYFDSTA
jgi:hypothetical protein